MDVGSLPNKQFNRLWVGAEKVTCLCRQIRGTRDPSSMPYMAHGPWKYRIVSRWSQTSFYGALKCYGKFDGGFLYLDFVCDRIVLQYGKTWWQRAVLVWHGCYVNCRSYVYNFKIVTLLVLCFILFFSFSFNSHIQHLWKNKLNLCVYHNQPICSPLYEIVFILYTWITLL